MQVLTIELRGNNSLKALQDLEKMDLIRIVKEPDLNSYALPGENISDEDFNRESFLETLHQKHSVK